VLVRGNHDRGAGDPPESLGITCVDPPLLAAPFALTHHPRAVEDFPVIAGHLHPAVRLSGPGRQHERLPCFWIGERVTVLPAFGDFTGVADVEPVEGDRIFAIAERAVVELGIGVRDAVGGAG